MKKLLLEKKYKNMRGLDQTHMLQYKGRLYLFIKNYKKKLDENLLYQ